MITSSPVWDSRVDLIVVGSGVAGLTAALHAQSVGMRVLVLTKDKISQGSTRWAQGGIAVALPETGDSVDQHVADTLTAGAGLCDERAVRMILSHGATALAQLRQRGAVFDTNPDGTLALTREGGHRAFRVVHAGGDATGAEVERALLAATRDARVPLVSGYCVLDLLVSEAGSVGGLVAVDAAGQQCTIRSPAVLLATGGLGQIYAATTNPEVATGDGMALALRAGASLADCEFIQFHPTVLYTGPDVRGRRPLVTEALRGEGAVLVDASGALVMAGVHPLKDLAPRNVVAAAITRRMSETGSDHVFLDATHIAAPEFRRRFPTVYSSCTAAGIDPATEPIPVTPAAHYSCGGVVTDAYGRTAVPGLYAAGEVARTGLHGANRLASNGLLEGLVMGARAAQAAAEERRILRETTISTQRAHAADPTVLRNAMSQYVGIGRDHRGLQQAATAINRSVTARRVQTRQDVEAVSMTLTAQAVLLAAATRTESRGCHIRRDYPLPDDDRWQDSVSIRLDETGQLSGDGVTRNQGVA